MYVPYYFIKATRYACGMTQVEAAKAIGISPTTYRRAEAGKSIQVGTWKKISDYYRIEKHPQHIDKAWLYNSSDDERNREIE